MLADHEVGFERLDVGDGILDIVVDVEVVDFAEVGTHEVQELAVVVDEDHAELLSLSLEAQWLDVERQLLACFDCQFDFALLVQLQTILGSRLCLLLGILQRALHLGDTCNNL